MRALDVGVLAYAANRHAPEHARAARVVETLAHGDAPWALPLPAVHEFVRLVTHPHAVARALAPADAWAFVEALLASRSVRLLAPGEGYTRALAEVLRALPAGGLPPGLETAVVLREHGVRELLSADRGMRRFGFLEVRDPIHGEAWSPAEPPARRYRRLRTRPAEA
jgi:uncharacterized protein